VVLDGGDPDDAGDALAACTFADGLLLDPELRSEATGGLASRVSVHAAVRQALYQRQRSFALQPGGAVLDGRDIGTVIAPDADAKLFVTASVEARALRRWKEMQARGVHPTMAEIEDDLRRRDERDRSRAEAPLRAADDAIVLDTSELDPTEATAAAMRQWSGAGRLTGAGFCLRSAVISPRRAPVRSGRGPGRERARFKARLARFGRFPRLMQPFSRSRSGSAPKECPRRHSAPRVVRPPRPAETTAWPGKVN
jgi:cytidylate kinase